MTDKVYKILAIDGGPAGPVQVRTLRKLEEQFPGFLASTDVFVGSSDGALIAMFLASRLPSDYLLAKAMSLDIIDDAILFSNTVVHALQPTFWTSARFMAGRGALINPAQLEAVLIDAFGSAKIADIPRDFYVLAFDADKWEPYPVGRLAAKIFNHDSSTTIVDVLMGTSSLPMYVPVHENAAGRRILDGAVAANDPSRIAALELLKALGSIGQQDQMAMLESRVRVLSLGLWTKERSPLAKWPTVLPAICTLFSPHTPDGKLDWGWFDWLLNRPGLLYGVFYQGQSIVGEIEGERGFGVSNYLRYTPDDNTMAALWYIMNRNADKVIANAEKIVEEAWAQGTGFVAVTETVQLIDFAVQQWLPQSVPLP